ncbi:MAG: hypothetical protein GXP24_01730 [Planctomycetes bacterium]|nr:hypothetical protein [Planctomycetota bacterium]
MRGGHFVETWAEGTKRACTLRQTAMVLLAIHFAWASSATTFCALAQPNHEAPSAQDEGQCAPNALREQSIVIADQKLVEGETPPATDPEDEASVLQPIATVSPNIPDLAEPQAIAQVSKREDSVCAEVKSPKVSSAGSPAGSSSSADESPELLTMAEIEVASFHGITPGISNRINVLRTWGDPRSDDTQAAELKYRFDNLPAVIVRFDGNQVESILVQLAKPTSTSTLIHKLNLQRLRPVTTLDEEGTAIAQVFPEHGVELRFAAQEIGLAIASDDDSKTSASPRVDRILIQSIQAEPFLWRAEANAKYHFANTIADLEAALRLDRNLGTVRAQLSEIHLKTGKAITAERYAAEAVELDSQNAAFRLQWAKCLRQLARYDQAVEKVQHVLETPGIAPLIRAQALNEMGLLASLGSQKVAKRAMPLHSKAIEIADRLAVDDDPLVRLPAKQLLVEAHLAVAVEISVGDWQQKDESVPQWIERASALAEALIAEDSSYLPLRLQVAVSSLAAAANLEKPINPLLWIEEAEETVTEIKTGTLDSLAVGQYDWQLGLAYFHGAQIEHRRSKPDSAIHLGELADLQLAELAKGRDELPDTAYLLGRLYFQIGAVHAVHYEDHLTACQWYDQAADRLLNPVPVTTMAAPQQHGDALVSMGVSYWNQGNRLQAIKVTEAGVELIEQAVSSGLLEDETLQVSYSNLAAMHEAQGEEDSATRYERLAREIMDPMVTIRR